MVPPEDSVTTTAFFGRGFVSITLPSADLQIDSTTFGFEMLQLCGGVGGLAGVGSVLGGEAGGSDGTRVGGAEGGEVGGRDGGPVGGEVGEVVGFPVGLLVGEAVGGKVGERLG